MLETTNCPNCGAPITGYKCEYCGTTFQNAETETITLYADGKAVLKAVLTEEKPRGFGISVREAAKAVNMLAGC